MQRYLIFMLVFFCLTTASVAQENTLWRGTVTLRLDETLHDNDRFRSELLSTLAGALKTNRIPGFADPAFSEPRTYEGIRDSLGLTLFDANAYFLTESWMLLRDRDQYTCQQQYLHLVYFPSNGRKDISMVYFRFSDIASLLQQKQMPNPWNEAAIISLLDVFREKLYPFTYIEVLGEVRSHIDLEELLNEILHSQYGRG